MRQAAQGAEYQNVAVSDYLRAGIDIAQDNGVAGQMQGFTAAARAAYNQSRCGITLDSRRIGCALRLGLRRRNGIVSGGRRLRSALHFADDRGLLGQ